MKIKRLEIHGFKSFADRARLHFGKGISGVVGPNGCGKSNIVDAIRWCMGEMSAKHLRGKAMQDVIFAGSDSRGPSGISEVTLTFHNDGAVPVQYAEYEELSVTRRLHRDGTSEYLINKVPVRLRDITDLFLGTGVGTRAYSIIEQGRIGFIVSSKPEDRRSLIEEVAGITKFKARKKAAERRLQATEQNLLRVNDIISELERQLNSLRRQAKKAERYKKLREEMRDLELHASTVEYLRMRAVEQVQRGERQVLEQRLEEGAQKLAADESSIEADRERLDADERRLQERQQVVAEAEAKLAALRRDLEHWREQAQAATEREGSARREVTSATERKEQAQRDHEQLSVEREALERDLASKREEATMAQASLAEKQSELSSIDETLESLRQATLEQVHGLAQMSSRLDGIAREESELENRQLNTGREKARLEAVLAECEPKEQSLVQRQTQAQEQLASWESALEQERASLKELTQHVEQSEAKLQAHREKLSDRRSRLESLEEIARRLEGYSDGVRALLGDDAQEHGCTGLRGIVGDLLEVDKEYEVAIEAALGERIQAIVVDGAPQAEAAIAHLRQHKSGRGAFVPLGEVELPAGAPSGAVSAMSVVRVPSELTHAMQRLLGHVFIVPSLDAALASVEQGKGSYTCVTVGGDLVTQHGEIHGGEANAAGVLAKRREIRELADEVEALGEAYTEKTAAHEALVSKRLQVEVNIEQLSRDIHAAQLEKVEIGKDLDAVRDELKRTRTMLDTLEAEAERTQLQQQALRDERVQLVTDMEEQNAKKSQAEERGQEDSQRRRDLLNEIETRAAGVTQLKVELASAEEKMQAFTHRLEQLDATVVELGERIERESAAIVASQEAAADLDRRMSEGAQQETQLSEEIQEKRQELNQARDTYETDRKSISGVEQAIREQRRENEVVQESLVQLKMDLQRLEMERERLIEQIAERHDVNLLEVICEYHTLPLPSDEDTKRRMELERSIKNMGSINLTAIEECKEIEERHGFLAKQRDDLKEAVQTLRRAIQQINRTSRERFREAYDAVNDMFKRIYPRLFRGGEARLELTQAEDVLEAGVEIIAQPPGKKLQNVSLMSGGEKALTATALVFAIFLVKPSPFCILDEVDAPLDEANVGRFNELLREMSEISQFIVITHNKRTMTSAGKLYGVTMEEPGMSKIVAVDLEQAQDVVEEAA